MPKKTKKKIDIKRIETKAAPLKMFRILVEKVNEIIDRLNKEPKKKAR